jgi:hypothetical protein
MDADVRVLLREGLDRLAEETTVPPGLTGLARQHNCRRRRVMSAAAAAATAATAAGVFVAVTVPGTGPGGGIAQARTAAYMLSRAADATRGQVMVATLPTSHYPPGSGYQIRAYGNRVRWNQFVGRRLVLINLSRTAAGRTTVTMLDPPKKQWSRAGGFPANPSNGCATADSPSFVSSPGMEIPADFASYIRATRSCGAYTMAGHARIGGADTVKLRYQGTYKATDGVTVRSHGQWITAPGSRGRLVHFHYTLYVNAATYLPVRMSDMGPANLTGPAFSHEDFRWLPATQANRAALHVRIPAGYHRISAGYGYPGS